jgi:hypothetical protein
MMSRFISEERTHTMRAFLFSVAKAFKRATKRVTSQSRRFEEVAEEVLVQEKAVTLVATEKGMMQPAVSKAALEMDDALEDFCKETGLVRAEVVLTPKALKTVLELEEEIITPHLERFRKLADKKLSKKSGMSNGEVP